MTEKITDAQKEKEFKNFLKNLSKEYMRKYKELTHIRSTDKKIGTTLDTLANHAKDYKKWLKTYYKCKF